MGVLATLESLELDDVDQLNGVSSDWTIESIQLKPGQHRFSATRIVFPDLMVERYQSNLAKHDLYELPSDTTLISIFRPGISPGHWCGYTIPDDVALINQSGREHFAVLPCGHEGIAILMDNELLARWNLLPESLYSTCRISPHHIVPLNNPVSLEARRWFFRQFNSPSSMSELSRDPFEAELFREELLSVVKRMLRPSFPEPKISTAEKRNPSRRFEMVRQACAVANSSLTESLTTRQLAERVGVSVRALQRGFDDVFGMPAFSFLLSSKLQAVRRELHTHSPASTTVSQIALRFGFTELGRFSGRYRKMFGELPSTTLQSGN